MCQVGDIILVTKYNHNGLNMDKHSFVVLSIESGQIEGMDFNLVCNVMSSFKDKNQKTKKMKYPGNFPIVLDDRQVKNDNGVEGYIKTDQLYYFDREKIKYRVLGHLEPDIFNLLLDFIEELNIQIEQITSNLHT